MKLSNLFAWLPSALTGGTDAPAVSPARPALRVEGLEAREVPALFIWDGGAGTSKWGDAANWETDTAPNSAFDPDIAIQFNSGVATTQNIPGLSVNIVAFDSGGSTVTLQTPLILDGSGVGLQIVNVTGTNTITGGGGLVFAGDTAACKVTAGKLILDTGLSGSEGLSLTDGGASGVMELRGDATYTGNTYVGAGTLALNRSPGANNTLGGGLVTIGGSGVAAKLQLLALAQLPDAIDVEVLTDGTFDVNGQLEGIDNLTLAGGTAKFSNGGLLTLGGDLTSTGTSAILNSGAVTPTGSLNLSTGDHTFGVTGTLTIDAGVVGTGKLVKTGTGTLALSQPTNLPNTYSGGTFVKAGTLLLDHDGTNTAVGTGPLTIGDGVGAAASAVVKYNQSAEIVDAITIAIDTDGQLQTNGKFDVLGDIVFDGGSVLMDGGGFTLNGGLLAHGNAQIATTANGGTITLPAGSHAFDVDSGYALGVAAKITGGGDLYKLGSGTLEIKGTAANDYTGVTRVERGTLLLNKPAGTAAVSKFAWVGPLLTPATLKLAAANQIPDDGTVVVNNGAFDLNGFNEKVGPLLLDSQGAIVTGAGTLTLGGDVSLISTGSGATMTGNFDLGGASRKITATDTSSASDLVIDGIITGAGGVTLDGSGTVELKGSLSNNYTGTTSVANGTLLLNKVPGANAIPHTLIVGTTVPGAVPTVRLAGAAQIDNAASVWVAANGHLDLNGKNDQIAGLLLGSGPDGGEVTTGAGKLILGGDVSAAAGSGLSTISGNIDLGGATRTFTTGTGSSLSVSAVVSNGGVIKEGAGTMTMTGANTYTGDTVVNAGNLAVNGTQAGSDVQTTGGTLSGTGPVGKLLGGAGTVAPGSSVGTLTSKNLNLTGGKYSAELGGAASDQIKVTGTVTLGGAVLDPHLLSPTQIGQVITIIDNDGTADAVVGTFAGLPQNATFTAGGRTYRISYTGVAGTDNDVVLTDVTPNTPPTISDTGDLLNPNGAIGFAVNDADTPAAQLNVTVSSSNPTLFPAGSLVLGGSGVNRSLTFTPAAGQFGTAVVTLTVTDANGGQATDTFTVIVTAPAGGGNGSAKPITDLHAVGVGQGGAPHVQVFNADHSPRFSFYAYDPAYTGGVNVATGDVTGDGVDDIVTGTMVGGGPNVRIFDGATGQMVRSFFAYPAEFTGGLRLAVGDLNNDGHADIVCGVGSGGGPNVRVFDGADGTILRSFFAYAPEFTGGVNIAIGDMDGDGQADILTGVGSGGGPNVRVFDGKTGDVARSFYVYAADFTGGVNVAAGDVTGDGIADVVTGIGSGGGPNARVYNGPDNGLVSSFYAYDPAYTGGLRVATADFDGDGVQELLVGPGPGALTTVKGFGKAGNPLFAADAYSAAFQGGVFVG